MPAVSGRDLIIEKNGTPIAGVRSSGFSIDNSPVNITSKDDAGFRTLADFAGERSLDITVEGVWKDDVISAIALDDATQLLTDITIIDASGATISGDFYLASFEQTGDHDGEVTYSAELQSSGIWTVTPAAP